MAVTPDLLEMFGCAYEIKDEGGQAFRRRLGGCLEGKADLPYSIERGYCRMVRLKITSKGQIN
jgi:hypothetical protein